MFSHATSGIYKNITVCTAGRRSATPGECRGRRSVATASSSAAWSADALSARGSHDGTGEDLVTEKREQV